MKCNMLRVLMDLSDLGLLVLSKEGEDLRKDCEMYLNGLVKRRRGRPRKEQESISVKSEDVIGRLLSSNEEEEELPIKVKKIEIEGDPYLISIENILYSMSSHEEVGSFHNNTLQLVND